MYCLGCRTSLLFLLCRVWICLIWGSNSSQMESTSNVCWTWFPEATVLTMLTTVSQKHSPAEILEVSWIFLMLLSFKWSTLLLEIYHLHCFLPVAFYAPHSLFSLLRSYCSKNFRSAELSLLWNFRYHISSGKILGEAHIAIDPVSPLPQGGKQET